MEFVNISKYPIRATGLMTGKTRYNAPLLDFSLWGNKKQNYSPQWGAIGVFTLKNLERHLVNLVKAKVVKGALEMSYATMHINRTDSWVLWPYEMCEHLYTCTYFDLFTPKRYSILDFSLHRFTKSPPAEILASFDLL